MNDEKLDTGIRLTVHWLRRHGFHTTDSGDGVSKPAAEREMGDIAHVFMRVDPPDLIRESLRLFELLHDRGLTPDPGTIQASYDPADGIGILALLGVDDASLVSLS